MTVILFTSFPRAVQHVTMLFGNSRREPNSHGLGRQICAPAVEKHSQLSYIGSHFLFASAKYLLAQNCTAPSGTVFFVGFCQNEAKQDEHLARRDWAKDAKNTRRRAYEVWFSSAIVFTDFKKQNKAKNADLFTPTKFYVIMVIMKERAL
ncbi:MAG: hypothetical protein IKA06_02890 [Clostridia bacterium]|nr:hypothetical protein [Clostridia bacterium]